MRLGGNRYRLYLARRALPLACLMLAVSTASAAAATRYAVPSGGLTSGTCTVGNECTIDRAVNSASGGDTVYIAPGTYSVSTPLSRGNVDLRGQGATKPRLVGTPGLTSPTLKLSNGSSLRDVRVESSSGDAALDLDGTADRIEVYASGTGALILAGGSSINNAVVHTSAPNATAVRVSGGLLSTTTVSHSTIVATGAGSKGLDSTGLGLLAAPSVSSSIVHGVGSDITGDLLASVSVSYSAYRSGLSSFVSGGATNKNAAASFVDAGGLNFQQASGSVTVNNGNNADGTALDVDGRRRTIAEGTDIGAYELPIPPDATTGTTSNLTGTSVRIGATVNPRGSQTSYQIEYGTDTPPSGSSGSMPLDSGTVNLTPTTDLDNLTPASHYYYRVVASNEWGDTAGLIQAFDTPSIAPVSTTDAASPVTATTAHLNGRVNPGGAATDAKFEWGDTPAYGTTTSVQAMGSGTSTLTLCEDLTGLTPNKTYYYRVSAVNSNGTVTGLQGSFTTPPRAPITSVGAAGGLSTSSATLAGTVDPGGATTSWQFDYGVGAYDQTAPGGSLTGTTPQAVGASLTGLLPGTKYRYRLVATNSEGSQTSTGTFETTVALPGATTGAPTSVTARRATVGGTLNPGGDEATYRIQFGESTAYGRTSAAGHVDEGTDDVSVTRSLTGLAPGTVHHYRLVVSNDQGTTRGSDATFTTPVALPDVSSDSGTELTETGALLSGAVNPGGGATSWSFEYGRTTAYGQTTAETTLTAGNDDECVATRIEGLEPGVTYHFRLVARNAAGETLGEDATFTTVGAADTAGGDDPVDPDEPVDDVPVDPAADGPTQADGLPVATEAPPVGRAANAAPTSGTIEVKLPGSSEFVALTAGASIPMGSVLDATDGQVTITSAADSKGHSQTASFGGSQFRITQKRAARPLTDITLTGGDFSDCFPRALNRETADVFAAARRKWSRRRLWGNGHGRFRTRGRHGTATVRGTHWLTEDRCDGTLVRVKRGLVEVRDLERRRTVMVGAGEQYFAKSLRAAKAGRNRRH